MKSKFIPRHRFIFPAVVFATSAALTQIFYPKFISQDPFILFFVAVAINSARRGTRVGLLTGFLGALFATYAMVQGPHGLSLFSLALFFLSSILISFHLGKRYRLEANLRREIEERKRIEESLKIQEENLRLALSSERSGVWDWNILSGEVSWSPDLERLRGIEVGSFGGRLEDVMRDVHPADRGRMQEAIQRALASRENYQVDYRIIKPNQEIAWLESHGSFRFDEKGQPIRLVGLCTDVTPHKRAEETHSRLSAIVTSSADAILSESLDGEIMTWNAGAERIFGYTAEEMIGQNISLLTPADRLQEPVHMVDLVRCGQALYQTETQRIHKSGRVIDVSVSISPVRNAQGEIIGISKIARDITTRKRSQQRERFLMEASDLLGSSLAYEATLKRLAALTIPEIADWCSVYILKEDGELKRVAIAHHDEGQVRRAVEFDTIFPHDPHATRGLYKVIRTGEADIFSQITDESLQVFSRNQEHFDYIKSLNLKSGMIVPLHAHGKTFGAIMLMSTQDSRRFGSQDLLFTQELGRRAGLAIENSRLYLEAQKAVARYEAELVERARIEHELRQAKEAADQSSRVKSAFLANMSHEIRTPLGAILGFSELLVSTEQSPVDRQESLEVITRNGKLLSNIINDILDLTKVESGRLEVERLAVPLVPLFEETRSSLSLLASEKGIGLTLSFGENLSDAIVTDPLRLKQILINIIGNAIKFTAQGGVQVDVQSRSRDEGTDLLSVEVRDSGKGLSEEEIAKLFGVFSQADVSTTRKFGGTGLGLVLARQLAKVLGGDVRLVESQVGVGSVFVIEVDTGVRMRESLSLRYSERNTRSAKSLAEGRVLDGIKVLVVEDARDNQLLMSRILRLDGAVFEIAENGAVGVEKALSKEFDVVLMDVQMPIMDGFEAMLELRRLGYGKPIIALTAHAMREDRERCIELGFNDYMSKPVERSKLREFLVQYSNHPPKPEPSQAVETSSPQNLFASLIKPL